MFDRHLEEILRLEREILRRLNHHNLSFTEIRMFTGPGTSGVITATYTVNGVSAIPTTPVEFTSTDPAVVFSANPDDTTGLSALISAPSSDTATSTTLGATCGNSDGSTSSATPLTVTYGAATPNVYSLSIALS